jgi:two-component system LytT family response regulator
MYKVILIDDEPLARSVLAEYLQAYPDVTIVQECNDGFEGVKAISQHQPDLIFLDIQMPKITGFEMLELIDNPPNVIFTTAFDEYAIKAFEAHAVDYLLKPFGKERLDKALKKWKEHYKKSEEQKEVQSLIETTSPAPDQFNRVVVKTGTKIRIIPVHDIHYLEAYDDYVKLHTPEGIFLKKKTMNYFEEVLDKNQFIRVHRSYIVQIPQVVKIEPYEKESHIAILKSGARVPISKSGYPKLKIILGI